MISRSTASWKRALLFMLAVTAVLLLLFLVVLIGANATAAATGLVNVTVSPGQVDRYEAFVVTVATAYPNTTFVLTFSGPGYVLDRNGTTNTLGLWEDRLTAALDFGTYTLFVTAGNETAQATLTIGCSPRCVVDIQNTWGVYNAELIAAGIFQVIIVVTVVLLVVEGPKTAHYFWKNGAQAIRRGQLTTGDLLKSPLAVLHGFVQPGRLSMRADVNDRIAVDLRRRALIEEAHDATQPRFMEYDPDHATALRDIFTDLLETYDREGRMTTRTPPLAHKFERTEKDMSETIEMAETEAWLAKENAKTPMQAVIDRHDAKVDRRRLSRRFHVASALFVAVGLPAGLMAFLAPLSYMGIYLEVVRPLWNPVFGDLGKFLIGVVLFLGSLVAVVREYARRAVA